MHSAAHQCCIDRRRGTTVRVSVKMDKMKTVCEVNHAMQEQDSVTCQQKRNETFLLRAATARVYSSEDLCAASGMHPTTCSQVLPLRLANRQQGTTHKIHDVCDSVRVEPRSSGHTSSLGDSPRNGRGNVANWPRQRHVPRLSCSCHCVGCPETEQSFL